VPANNTLTPLLDSINIPADLKQLSMVQIKQLADELRTDLINQVSKTGGHLGASLGVVELTTALHYVFNTPDDKIIWDVGHQSYPHKILTGRRQQMHTLRQGGGLSGFAKRKESEYDPFGAGHSSTSISAGLGMAVASQLKGQDNHVIAVIGDGAMSAGMAYEAINNAGALKSRLIVVLNDNDMSIAQPTGAMSKYLNGLVSSKPFLGVRNVVKSILPSPLADMAKKAENIVKEATRGGTFFEDLGFHYIGVVDGHDVEELVHILSNLRDNDMDKPILLHIATKKGKGYAPAEAAADKYHGVAKFDVATGKQSKGVAKAPSYTKVFSDTLIKLAAKDDAIIAINAAMPDGTGLDKFAAQYPNRSFDVGIAEQHAVTFAAGLACEGLKPYVAIYSTFLQRAYDQIVHDVAIQNLPVKFMIDRAGLVGADGPTHAGSYDIAYLSNLPNFVVMAAADEAELVNMIASANAINNRPVAVRYPRGEGVGIKLPVTPKPIKLGQGRYINKGKKLAILNFGARLDEAKKAAKGKDITIFDARFAKPLDKEILNIAKAHDSIITIEEGAIGGFATQVTHLLAENGLLTKLTNFKSLLLPDYFVDHNTPQAMYEEVGLTQKGIEQAITKILG